MQTPPHVRVIVKACLALHNLLRKRVPLQPGEVDHDDAQDGEWRRGRQLTDTQNLIGNYALRVAKIQRSYLMDYYNSPYAALPWQDRIVDV